MYSVNQLTKHREFTFHLLRRFMRHHCPISLVVEIDVTDLMAEIQAMRDEGKRIGFVACLTKATAMTISAHPELNNRFFRGLFGPIEATYDHITCGMLAERTTESGEKIVIPLIIPNIVDRSVEELHRLIKETKSKPLNELSGYNQLAKVSKLPRFLMPFFHFLFRVHPRFTAAGSSTYGISSTLVKDGVVVGGHAPANQTTFFPAGLRQRVVPIGDEICVRTIFSCVLCAEHYLVDGLALQRASVTFRHYLEEPARLFASNEES